MVKKSIFARTEESTSNQNKQLDICSDEGRSGLEGAYLKELIEIDKQINQIIEQIKQNKPANSNIELEKQLSVLKIKKEALKKGHEKLIALHDAQEEFEKIWALNK